MSLRMWYFASMYAAAALAPAAIAAPANGHLVLVERNGLSQGGEVSCMYLPKAIAVSS